MYKLFTALLLALGRAGLAVDRSVMPRYIPMTIFMPPLLLL